MTFHVAKGAWDTARTAAYRASAALEALSALPDELLYQERLMDHLLAERPQAEMKPALATEVSSVCPDALPALGGLIDRPCAREGGR